MPKPQTAAEWAAWAAETVCGWVRGDTPTTKWYWFGAGGATVGKHRIYGDRVLEYEARGWNPYEDANDALAMLEAWRAGASRRWEISSRDITVCRLCEYSSDGWICGDWFASGDTFMAVACEAVWQAVEGGE